MVNKEPRTREVAQIRQLFVVQINQFCIGFFGYRNTMWMLFCKWKNSSIHVAAKINAGCKLYTLFEYYLNCALYPPV